jgi:predicted outer membrane repeat protein
MDNQTDNIAIVDGDVLESSNDYYFNSSHEENGNGSVDNPYNDLNGNIRANSVNHLSNGQYHINDSLEFSDVSLIGENPHETVIECNGNPLNISKSLKLVNVTLRDFTIVNRGTLTCENTIFDGGYAVRQDEYGNSFGGAIYTPYGTKSYRVDINNCTFKNCYAEYGGAIYMDGGQLNVLNSVFMNNIAYNYGGAIACEYGTKISINRTRFVDDRSVNDAGGAIYLKLCELNSRDLTVINSTATFGSAITALNSKVTLLRFNAHNNSARFEGGAIYQLYGEFSIQQSSLINNSARNGGAIYVDNVTSILVANNLFENNRAEITGGAYYSVSSAKIRMMDIFRGNSAQFYPNGYEAQTYDYLNIGNGDYQIFINEDDSFNATLPRNYSLADEGYVSSIKNQQYGGNCWAFSALASLESCILKATGKELDLSEENMKNLIQRYSSYGLDLDTNDGGYISTGIGYLVSWLGPIYELQDPYDDCSVVSPLINSLMHIQNVLLLKRDNYTDNDAIKKAIMRYGAVGTGISYYADYLNKQTNAYYCPYGSINHAVTIVGWDDDFLKSNFRGNVEGNGAWIVKNSWGNDWGDDGFFYVSYYDGALAKVGLVESSFTFILNDSMRYDRNYQYDVSGKTNYFSNNDGLIWYRNIFKSSGEEFLAAVSTYFEKESSWNVSIFVNGVLKLVKSGTSSAGYYTINLGELIRLEKGDEFAVVFNVASDDYARIPVCEKDHVNRFISSPGISHFSYDGKVWNDLYTASTPCVACIKAFTLFDKLDTTLALNVSSSQFNPVEITAKVLDEYGRVVNHGNVIFKVEGVAIPVSIENGTARLRYNFTKSGPNAVEAILDSECYCPGNASGTVNVSKVNLDMLCSIKVNIDKATVDLNLSRNINASVILLVNAKEYVIDLVNGCASKTLDKLIYGNYEVHAVFSDYIYEAYANSSFNVSAHKYKITAKNSVTYFKSGAKYSVRLIDEFGKAGAGGTVKFKLNGRTYSVRADRNGYASIKVSLAAKKYKVVCEGSGFKVSKTITVKPTLTAKNLLKKKANVVKFQAKLLNSNGKPFKNKIISFKIKGKTLKAKTNSKGIAIVALKNLKVGKYTIISSYGAAKIKNTITIKK